MKKSILNLGTALNKAEQKEVFGGNYGPLTFYAADGSIYSDGGVDTSVPCSSDDECLLANETCNCGSCFRTDVPHIKLC